MRETIISICWLPQLNKNLIKQTKFYCLTNKTNTPKLQKNGNTLCKYNTIMTCCYPVSRIISHTSCGYFYGHSNLSRELSRVQFLQYVRTFTFVQCSCVVKESKVAVFVHQHPFDKSQYHSTLSFSLCRPRVTSPPRIGNARSQEVQYDVQS